MLVAIYIRVSTDEQIEGYSLAEQEHVARAYCATRGWPNIKVYADEGISAFKDTVSARPALQQLLDDVRAKRVQVVVVQKLDRFFRRAKLLIATVEELIDQRGVVFVSVAEQIDFTTPAGRVMLANLGAFAEYYSRNLSAETKKGLAGKARAGDWVGPVPFGYMRDGKTLAPSSDAWIVQLIFESYATGEHSYTTIADDLNRRGLQLRHWRDGLKRFGRESIRSILANPAYKGVVTCKMISVTGRHPALIGPVQWDLCAAIRERRERASDTPALRGVGGLLSELAYCAQCGARLWAHRSGRNGTLYYRCAHRREYGESVCATRMIKAVGADESACDLVRACAIPPHIRARVLTIAEQAARQAAVQPTHDPARIKRQLARLRLAWLDGDSELTDEIYYRERQRLEQMISLVPLPPPDVLSLEKAAAALTDMASAIDTAKPPQRRMLLQTLVKVIWLEKGIGVARWMPMPVYGGLIEAVAVCGGCPTGDEHTSPILTIPPRVYAPL